MKEIKIWHVLFDTDHNIPAHNSNSRIHQNLVHRLLDMIQQNCIQQNVGGTTLLHLACALCANWPYCDLWVIYHKYSMYMFSFSKTLLLSYMTRLMMVTEQQTNFLMKSRWLQANSICRRNQIFVKMRQLVRLQFN